ncbi:hypothetical protein BURPS668_A1814 [Burkholderia pseudomallei 668]|nr:hypothetical protein BURPS668_A1814 [Burkholderia pseudomallei 668]
MASLPRVADAFRRHYRRRGCRRNDCGWELGWKLGWGARLGLGRVSVGSRSGLGWQPGRGPVGDLIDAWPGAR